MHQRKYTLAQANALIPWLTEVFTETRRNFEELQSLRSANRSVDPLGRPQGDENHARIRSLEAQIHARVQEVTDLGIEVRKIDGLADFPAWIDGELVFLCWCLGETEITHWHPCNEGFSARKALPSSAKPELN